MNKWIKMGRANMEVGWLVDIYDHVRKINKQTWYKKIKVKR